ncbi:HAD-IIIA family hydrolase [Compostibacter hankyongensis]|uniref:D,D-heptose 1,7-bisphosphate phosphatase n=1 Tax=Compostibacter hankyongensis TaxID=1007089 RepID=A0ABP8FQ22_9BACT
MTIALPHIDRRWTLFLDRDGVINVERPDDYVRCWEQFVFYEDVLPALRDFAKQFGTILMVTNQRGVAKGVMSLRDLEDIHLHMTEAITAAGGRLDRIYCCTDMEAESPCRKPNTGMGLAAQKDFPQLDFSRALIIGNNLSDMEFGKRLGMYTCLLQTTHPELDDTHPLVDMAFPHLSDLINALRWARLPGG